MPVELTATKSATALPIHFVTKGRIEEAGLAPDVVEWAKANGFTGQPGRLGISAGSEGHAPLISGALGKELPEGDWHFAAQPADPALALLGAVLGGYRFTRYSGKPGNAVRLAVPEGGDAGRVRRIADGVFLARDLVNTPTSDLGPAQLEEAVRTLGAAHDAEVRSIIGDALIPENFPLI